MGSKGWKFSPFASLLLCGLFLKQEKCSRCSISSMSSKGWKHFPNISMFVLQKKLRVFVSSCLRVKKMLQAFHLSGFLFVFQSLCVLSPLRTFLETECSIFDTRLDFVPFDHLTPNAKHQT